MSAPAENTRSPAVRSRTTRGGSRVSATAWAARSWRVAASRELSSAARSMSRVTTSPARSSWTVAMDLAPLESTPVRRREWLIVGPQIEAVDRLDPAHRPGARPHHDRVRLCAPGDEPHPVEEEAARHPGRREHDVLAHQVVRVVDPLEIGDVGFAEAILLVARERMKASLELAAETDQCARREHALLGLA